jgi:hypothetical protein
MDDKQANAESRPYCFVIMSFGDNPTLQDHYDLGIKPTVEECGFECVRADEVEHNLRITETIIGLIRNAHFVVADLTDERPNCYYELGYAHALRKNVIHTINKESSVHFDVKDYNFIVYTRLQELRDRLKQRIEATVESKAADPLPVIGEAIDRLEAFIRQHKEQMLRDRVTEHPVQSYNEKENLPAPFDRNFGFHVKDGLMSYSDGVRLKKQDGALYLLLERRRGWGHTSTEEIFEGLIRRAEHVDLLQRKIEQSYDAHKQVLEH